MSTDRNRKALQGYLEGHDPSAVADDAVFTDMSSGHVWRGRAEAAFIGRHIGEFAGVPATNKDVDVPLVVIYDFRDGQIVAARIFWTVPVFLAQVGAMPGPAAPTA